MKLSRIILFVGDVDGLSAFYQRHFGMAVVSQEKGWVELDGEGCNLALHKKHGKSASDSNAKICFGVGDVSAERARLESEGLVFGKSFEFEGMSFCDTEDLEGNKIQLSSRGMG